MQKPPLLPHTWYVYEYNITQLVLNVNVYHIRFYVLKSIAHMHVVVYHKNSSFELAPV